MQSSSHHLAVVNAEDAKKRNAGQAGLVDLNHLPEQIAKEDIEQILQHADETPVEVITAANIRRAVAQFEKRIRKNQEDRVKYAQQPEKFVKSEVDLDEEIGKLKQLAASPELLDEFREHGGLAALAGLLVHANSDIALDVVDCIAEITEADTLLETEDPEAFIESLLAAQLPELLVEILIRINEEAAPEDFSGVSNALQVIENLVELRPSLSSTFAGLPRLLLWLLKRVRHGGAVNLNRVYAAEILSILLQNSPEARRKVGEKQSMDGIDKLLRAIAVYRKRDPESAEEEEMLQNLFNCLCHLMLVPAHQLAFGKAQGLELAIRMMRERSFSYRLALKLTDYALNNCPDNCNIFVDKLGLKPIFALFMRRGAKTKKESVEDRQDQEHLVSVIQALCRETSGIATSRVLNKFVENDFEKLERLVELYHSYAARVAAAEAKLADNQKAAEQAAEAGDDPEAKKEAASSSEYLERCESGALVLQQVCVTLVRLSSMGNSNVSQRLFHLLAFNNVAAADVAKNVKAYCANLSREEAKAEKATLENFTASFLEEADLFLEHAQRDENEQDTKLT
eukprot:GHVT01061552.1.p1 GENE.GHVT01061552.1~~GHVT01061552.1.p1  ORF type:complete len:570 (-),score=158.31 GHVT01061552.1:618-2327(-)